MISLTEGLGDVSEHQPLNVTIRPIREDGRLVITDSGIGMTREELQNNLGTIARSGTSEFLSKISNSATTAEQASGLIGKFGECAFVTSRECSLIRPPHWMRTVMLT